ncbi:phage tail protein [Atlantibacter subterraneus]|uniref:phage tail protein n=1 Tax=Atlantibacter subterraneus TaxID=255519 RepID=UPI0022EB0EA8|nr:phage tail protein [Atlantibacter subterranea]MDA3131687.1 phage tail protein [Atlantibacter subterranea]
MATTSLKDPIEVQVVELSASSLPAGFNPVYQRYVLTQQQDLSRIAGKANAAGSGAYDAQMKNEEQDSILEDHSARLGIVESTLADHDQRLNTAESEIADHETRISQNTGDISTIQGEVSSLNTRVSIVESGVSSLQSTVSGIQTNYVSKGATSNQMVQGGGGSLLVGNVTSPTTDKLQVLGSSNVSIGYKVNGLQVVGPRQTGWTASTGSPLLGAFDANLQFPVSATYSQGEVALMSLHLTGARQRIKALEDVLRTHGLIA